ncbi:MAG: hypothetical protein ABI383_11580 [Acidobacteriaceae bacterium]
MSRMSVRERWTNRELGIDILMHGVSCILSGVDGFAAGMGTQFAGTPLTVMVSAFGLRRRSA